MTVRRRWGPWAALFLVFPFLALSPAGAATPRASAHRSNVRFVAGHPVGLGRVLSSSDGGQIFGWDINQNGTDGVLATSQNEGEGYKVSVQAFDQTTAKVTHTFARHSGTRDSYGADGIFAGDVALVTHYVVPHGTIYAKRLYQLMNPVTARRFTGAWTSPVKNFDVIQGAVNQSTSTSVLYGIELNHHSDPALVVSDLTTGTGTLIPLDRETFKVGSAVVAQDTTRNDAVLAASNGTVGGDPPIMALVNLTTGHVFEWFGLNEGPFGAGFVNGLAVDSGTGVACTTTELNAMVQFYDLKTTSAITSVQLPGTGPTDQLDSGAAIAVDPKHHLFLVSDPVYGPTGGSAIVVYRENGDFVEAITGIHFGGFAQGPSRIAVNAKLRVGWIDGPGIDQIQQFFY
jgi:hypothetical protein